MRQNAYWLVFVNANDDFEGLAVDDADSGLDVGRTFLRWFREPVFV
jgi:hypothetical protein